MSKRKATTEQRNITILVRYFIKKDHTSPTGKHYQAGSIILYVKNDKGETYYVTLRRNGIHSCSCKATKRCYHIECCREIENARATRERLAREVEEICAEAERDLTPAVPALVAAASPTTPARELVPLHSKPFSILRR